MTKSRQEAGQIAAKYVMNKLKDRNYKVLEKKNMTLSVLTPNERHFILKITSLSRRNFWILPRTEDKNSYFALVLKPDKEVPTCFILTPEQMMNERMAHMKAKRKPTSEYSNPDLESRDLGFEQPFPYENKWDSLPR